MKPLKLVMQAFESYGARTEIDFTKVNQNLFLIAGETGAGKTTIFNAITFALYGQTDSARNKTRGIELQSQCVDHSVLPYVELTFEEHLNGKPATYIVRRSPAHYEPSKRKGSPEQLKNEKVTLTMPDGSDYPEKEANRKIIEIIGLDKDQFMQVAMIAQGEFVDLVRTDSKNRKQIFRSIFHTDIYPRIVIELKNRADAKREDLKTIRAECVSQIQQITVPDDEPDKDTLLQLVSDISSSAALNPDQLNALMDLLQQLIQHLKENETGLLENRNRASQQRDLARDAYQAARSLQSAYNQLENAVNQLQQLDSMKASIEADRRLIDAINDAYEIESSYASYCDAARTLETTENSLKAQQNLLPTYSSRVESLNIKRQQTQKAYRDQQAAYAKVEERVQKAYEVFQNIAAADQEVRKTSDALNTARTNCDAAKNAQAAFETTIRQWQSDQQRLLGSDVKLEECRSRYSLYQQLNNNEQDLKAIESSIAAQNAKVQKAKLEFQSANEAYAKAKADYDEKNDIFLHEQAGFLARTLVEGKPCPVCGSTSHPRPAMVAIEHSSLTREVIDRLAKKAADANQVQTAASETAGKEAATLASLKQDHEVRTNRLKDAVNELISVMVEGGMPAVPVDPVHMDDTLQKIEIILKERGLQLRADTAQLADVQKKLATADVQRQKLEAEAAQAVEQLNAATVAANIALEKRKGLQNQTSYASKADAEQELAESLSILQAAEHDDKRTEQDLSSARTQADQCQATIVQLRDVQLPAQRQTTGTRKEAYEAACRDKAMDEAKWKSVVEQHRKNEVRTLQEAIEQYQSLRGKYEGMKATAVETIAGREKPDVGILQNTMAAAEEQLKSADTAYSRCQQMCMVDERIYEALSPKMAQHIDLARQFAEIDGLYRRLSGNQSGAHMDIETFVQRQYLQSILNAANQRFRQMSSNEFELRMIDDEHAGEGRTNQGLDLMVYSYATSETRRVETLSGGETFMAALSLALGMADQIQATSGSIHLDMMFIDEGFGSLDDHSRDNAIDVLKKMAGGSKLIGIISHVSELQQQIEDQLVVTRDVHTGSHARWIIS
ncbi:MAG TPA: hypothetical protein DGT58_02065 [Erysipelotrichaceae bacterium]|nr:hypothetical protein [Erysipelotrichaceae bacterium]